MRWSTQNQVALGRELVTLTFASWNRIADWLNRIQALQTAA